MAVYGGLQNSLSEYCDGHLAVPMSVFEDEQLHTNSLHGQVTSQVARLRPKPLPWDNNIPDSHSFLTWWVLHSDYLLWTCCKTGAFIVSALRRALITYLILSSSVFFRSLWPFFLTFINFFFSMTCTSSTQVAKLWKLRVFCLWLNNIFTE